MPEDLRQHWEAALSKRGRCSRCASTRVWHNGTRARKATILVEAAPEFFAGIPVRRLRCGDCKARWAATPERVSSRAHFQACVVGSAITELSHEPNETMTEVARAHGCHRRTLGRWVERVAGIADPVLLGAEVLAEVDAPVLPVVPTELPRTTGSPRKRTTLLRAMVILVLLEALASLRGFEPPALAHATAMVSRMPASARRPRIRGDPRSPGD